MAKWAWRIERSINQTELVDPDYQFARLLRASLPHDSRYLRLWQQEDPCLWPGIKCAGGRPWTAPKSSKLTEQY
eukprot:scaffold236_cov419-Prasinococcus_capsulatus_cf.AAC.3